MRGARLEARGLTVVRGGRELVRAIDLVAEPGKITVLIGSSGCGKTTILKALALLEPVQGGVIELEGRPLQDLDERTIQSEELRGHVLAYVFQSHALFDDLDVRANLIWALEHRRGRRRPSRSEQEDKVRVAARRAGLPPELRDRPVASLSGGERKRVPRARDWQARRLGSARSDEADGRAPDWTAAVGRNDGAGDRGRANRSGRRRSRIPGSRGRARAARCPLPGQPESGAQQRARDSNRYPEQVPAHACHLHIDDGPALSVGIT